MNKADLIAAVSERTGEPKQKVAEIVDATFDRITDALVNRIEVRIPSFGVFVVVRTAPRKARNPKTREEVPVPAGVRARFRPGRALKEAVDASKAGGAPQL